MRPPIQIHRDPLRPRPLRKRLDEAAEGHVRQKLRGLTTETWRRPYHATITLDGDEPVDIT